MVTINDVSALMDAAIIALDSGDYSTARRKAIAAQGRLALIPDAERSGGSGNINKMTWTRQSISDFIKQLRLEGNSSIGVQISSVQVDTVDADATTVDNSSFGVV